MEASGINSVFTQWLRSQQRAVTPFKFHVVNVWEEAPPASATVDFLSKEFVIANLSPKALRKVLAELKND